MRKTPPPPFSQSNAGEHEVTVSLSWRWNPEYLGPCYANIPHHGVGNPLSEKPDTTGARERGPLSVTASNLRAPHLHPRKAYPDIHTALRWGEGAETPTRTRRPRP